MTDPAPQLPNFDPMNPEHVREAFLAEIAPLTQRSDELIAAFDRAPEKVEDDQTESRMTTLAKQIGECAKEIEAKRKDHKGRYDKCGAEIHGIAKGYTDKLADSKGGLKVQVERRIGIYQRKKADEERRRREEEARRQQEEAERAIREAEAKTEALQSEDDLQAALAAEEEAKRQQEAADKARREAEAKPADLHRSRGEYGGVGSSRSVLAFEITDAFQIPPATLWTFIDLPAKEKAVRQYMRVHSDLLKKAVKAGTGDQVIPGVRFYEDFKTNVR